MCIKKCENESLFYKKDLTIHTIFGINHLIMVSKVARESSRAVIFIYQPFFLNIKA